MEESELKAAWKAGSQPGNAGAWTPEMIEAFRRRRSSSVRAYLSRRLRADLVWRAMTAIALCWTAALPWKEGAGALLSVSAALLTLALAWPVAVALRALTREEPVSSDVRGASAALLSTLKRIRRGALPALAATSSLAPLAFVLWYYATEYGALRFERPLHWFFTVAIVVLPFLATMWVVGTRIRASVQTLSACLGELDPEALAALEAADACSRRVTLFALAMVAAVFAAGVLMLLVR